MKKIGLSLMFFFVIISVCFADTIYLKSGRVIKGDVVEKTASQIKINANGMTLTYYADEVDRVEAPSTPSGDALASPSRTPSLQDPSLTASPANAAYASMSKKELILKYMEATGAKGNMRRTFSEIIDAASADKKEQLKQVLDLDDVMRELVPVYDQYFTEQDLRDLIAFYESPLGQKVLRTAPLILKDSMEKSVNYFQDKLK